MAFWECEDELNIDELVLACELAEPTVFSMSPGISSLSSIYGPGASEAGSLRRVWDATKPAGSSSGRDAGVVRPVSNLVPRDTEGESTERLLDLSSSRALFTTELGAFGKHAVKLEGGGGIILLTRQPAPANRHRDKSRV